MHYIVTGGAGFIGSHLTEQLLSEGHFVTVVDDLTSGRRENLPIHQNLRLLEKDVLQCQPWDFPEAVDGLVHLAATPSVVSSWEHPLHAHQNNLSTMLVVIQLCKALNIPRLVYASSAAVYGNPVQLPIDESHPTTPISPYGLQKLVSEQYLQLFAEQVGFSAVILRLFNVFGSRQVASSPYSGVISIFADAMAQGRSLTIFGDGHQTRDFVYVKDVAIGLSQGLTISLRESSVLICNIGTGKAVSLLELIELLRRYFPDWKADIQFKDVRSGDIQHSLPTIRCAMSHLGFTPHWSPVREMEAFVDSVFMRPYSQRQG
jgi:UDP-glucose 4-epimerase